MTHCTQLLQQRKLSQQNAVHYQQSVSRPKSKLVYSSLIFVDNKLTLICLLT